MRGSGCEGDSESDTEGEKDTDVSACPALLVKRNKAKAGLTLALEFSRLGHGGWRA